MRRSRGRRHDAEDEVLRLVREHAAELLRFARRFSLCADDAQDAYQRSLEILLRRMRHNPPEQPLRWLRTVLRHEALAIREQRVQDVDRDELDLDRHDPRRAGDPSDRVERFEQLSHAAEALRRLKPQEVTALVLRAEGLSYREICDRTGWTYTRCNRTVTEGRRAFVSRIRAIESGAECERWLPLLSLLADGEATARDLADLRPHLRSCRGCRATLRTFHAAPRQLGELFPVGLLPLGAAAGSTDAAPGLAGHLEALAHALAERATTGATRLQGALEIRAVRVQTALEALPASKMAAVAASTAAIAGGGTAIDQVATRDDARARSHAPQVAADTRSIQRPMTLAPAATGPPAIARPARSSSGTPRPAAAATTRRAPGPTPTAEFGFESVARPRERERPTRPAASTATTTPPAPPPVEPAAPPEFQAPPAQAAAAPPPQTPPSAPAEFVGP